ncbi:hypothetical protein P4O66_000249 [Electrophorus voltai]|uniref:Transposase Tc1-like domain-containing protein n=1 Tax=Electrophorus voltai TaxID=2609070 RepID=A0AAD8ZJR3_9TELE|nr:hypothetical protein P4O66_000249 [Electrophorus voltai]
MGQHLLQTGRGQNRLSTDRDDRHLIRMSLNNHKMTSSDLQNEWHAAAGVSCTARTVRNRLLEAGLKSCKAGKKPFINEKQRRARLKFEKDHKDWTVEDWSKVIFSDECNFQLCPTPGRVMVRRRPGEAYKPECLAPTVKFGAGSNYWPTISVQNYSTKLNSSVTVRRGETCVPHLMKACFAPPFGSPEGQQAGGGHGVGCGV